MHRAAEVAAGWTALEAGAFVLKDSDYFIEPYVYDESIGEYAILRIFASTKEAESYRAAMTAADHDMRQIAIVKITLQEIFNVRGRLYDQAQSRFGCKLQIALSKMDAGEWPEQVDSIFDFTQAYH